MADGWGGGREGLVESASANSPTTRERNTATGKKWKLTKF